MQIRKMRAVFGGLQDAELELQPGLNILHSGNETGKSTWSRFIRAMIYGISTAERAKQGSLPDRIRYLPWNGAAMQGRMELVWQGKEITLTRSAVSAGKPMGPCAAVLTGTGERVPELQGADIGEKLLGVSEPVFRRSAYLSGAELRVDADRELEKRLMRLVTSGEDLSSAKEAEERLRRWQRKRRWRGQSGSIPEAEQALEEKKNALARLEEGTKRLENLRLDRDRLQGRQEALKLELRRHRRDALLERRRRLAEAQREARELGEKADSLEEERSGRTGETADALRAAAVRLEEAEKDRAAMEELLRQAREEAAQLPRPEQVPRQPGRGLGILLILLGVLLAGFGVLTLLRPVLPGLPGWAGYALTVCILLAIPGILLLRRTAGREAALRQERQNELERAEARIQELERQLLADEEETAECAAALEKAKETAGCAGEEDPLAAADRLDALLAELEKARSGASTARRLAEALSDALEEEPEELEGETTLSREEAERRLGDTEYSLRETERALTREETMHGLLGDPLVLASEAEALRGSIAAGEADYAALDLAEQALAEAGRQMQGRFAPLVSREAGLLLKTLTGGRYTGIYFDREMRFSVQPADDLEPRSLEYLSEGTKNQVYLAVRLAICRLALGEEDPCPLILDDVMLTFDDTRAKRALELLQDLARERQILLFTCSGREEELLREIREEEKECHPQ